MQTERNKFIVLQQQADTLTKEIEYRRNHLEEEIWGDDVYTGQKETDNSRSDEIGDEVLGI